LAFNNKFKTFPQLIVKGLSEPEPVKTKDAHPEDGIEEL